MKTLVVETGNLRHNASLVLKRAENTAVYGVLKGDAYGLGLIETARILRDEGITRFAVTEPEDGVRLRGEGFIDEEILMLRSTSDSGEIEQMLEHGITATVGSYDAAVALNGLAEQHGTAATAHIKIDTGMGRYGFLPNETDKVISLYKYMPNLAITGIFTHLHSAFKSEKSVRAQLYVFETVLQRLRSEGIELGTVHAAGSSALFRYDFARYDAVRVGSAFCGRLAGKQAYGLLKVGHIESQITELRWLPKGSTVGYGAVYQTRRPTKIAVIPVGYHDGYCIEKAHDSFRLRDVVLYCLINIKKLFGGGRMYMRIGGEKARVLGHVGLTHTVADVTEISCGAGDTAILNVNPLYVHGMARRYI